MGACCPGRVLACGRHDDQLDVKLIEEGLKSAPGLQGTRMDVVDVWGAPVLLPNNKGYLIMAENHALHELKDKDEVSQVAMADQAILSPLSIENRRLERRVQQLEALLRDLVALAI